LPRVVKYIKSLNLLILGDAPACELEAGQQKGGGKGGHYPCWYCTTKFTRGHELGYTLYAKRESLQTRIDKLGSTR